MTAGSPRNTVLVGAATEAPCSVIRVFAPSWPRTSRYGRRGDLLGEHAMAMSLSGELFCPPLGLSRQHQVLNHPLHVVHRRRPLGQAPRLDGRNMPELKMGFTLRNGAIAQ